MHRVYHGFYNLQLFEECYLVGGAYRADLVGVRRGAKLDKEDIFGCDEEIFVAEVKPPEEYVTYDDVQKLGEAATIAKRELAEKRSLTVTGEDGEQHRVSINVKDKSRVCAIMICHKFSRRLMRKIKAESGFSFEQVAKGVYNIDGTFLGLGLRVIRIGELEGESSQFFRMLGRSVSEKDVRLFDRQVKELLMKAPEMSERCTRIAMYSRKYNAEAFEMYESESQEGRMGYYNCFDQVREEAYSKGHTEGLTEGLAKGHTEGLTEGRTEGRTEMYIAVENYVNSLEKTGRNMFTLDEVKMLANVLKSLMGFSSKKNR